MFGDDKVSRFNNPTSMKIAGGRIRDEKMAIDLHVWLNHYEGRFPRRVDGKAQEPHVEFGPFFTCTSDAGYEIGRRVFKVREIPKPTQDPDVNIPTLHEFLLREAGVER